MKIKCPECEFIFNENHSDFFILMHVATHLIKLQRKIREKIKSWEEIDSCLEYPASTFMHELESLLEDK